MIITAIRSVVQTKQSRGIQKNASTSGTYFKSKNSVLILVKRPMMSYFFDALHPVLNILKGFFISDVIHKDDALKETCCTRVRFTI